MDCLTELSVVPVDDAIYVYTFLRSFKPHLAVPPSGPMSGHVVGAFPYDRIELKFDIV